jgi:hypothetical protein
MSRINSRPQRHRRWLNPERKRPPSRSIHDVAGGKHILAAYADALDQAAIKAKSSVRLDRAKVIRALVKQYQRHVGNTSKYPPHQGARECARRIRQGRA